MRDEVPSSDINEANIEEARDASEPSEDPSKQPGETTANKISIRIKAFIKNLSTIFGIDGNGHDAVIQKAKDLGMNSKEAKYAASALGKISTGGKDGAPLGLKSDGTIDTEINTGDDIEDNKTKNGGITNDAVNELANGKIKYKSLKLNSGEEPALLKYLTLLAKKYRTNSKLNISSDVIEALKNPDSDKNKATLDDFFENKYGDLIKDNEERLTDNEIKNTPDREAKPKTKYGNITAILLFLEFSASLGAALYLLIKYARAHTGCMQIKYDSSKDNQIIRTKVFCGTNTTNMTNITYPPQACYCDTTQDYKTRTSSPVTTCNFNDKKNPNQPRPAQQPQNSLCKGSSAAVDNYLFYTYQIMDPASAALDIIQKGERIINKGFGDFMNILIKAAIVIGIIIAVLAVLFIIYKIVSNKGSSETVKVVSAPQSSTASQFGKYLRFSKYTPR